MINFNDKNEIVKEEIRAILVGVETNEPIEKTMTELEGLTEAAGGQVLGVMTQKLEKIDRSTYIGKGKVEELVLAVEQLEANTVIFNHELSGMQIRNLEEKLKCRVIDRTILILDIFASRATSKEGKLQVELAQLEYRMPRLLGFGKSLSRLGGGIGTRGPGEKKLEVDKRHIRKRIEDIKRELKEANFIRKTQRARREKNETPLIALVGYTNAGKSAIMNRILEAALWKDNIEDLKTVSSKNMLFETLDIQHRKVKIDNKKEAVLVDTVGFVSKLPHSLVEAFKSTLEEVKFANLLIHVVDISDEDYEFQEKVTNKVLGEIGVVNKETIVVYNKIDLLHKKEENGNICITENLTVDTEKNSIKNSNYVYVSAKNGKNIDILLDSIREKLFNEYLKVKLRIPIEMGSILSFVYSKGEILEEEYTDKYSIITAMMLEEDYRRVSKYDFV